MKSHNSAATDKALKLVAKGMSQVQAARACGLAVSTVWRACKRAQMVSAKAKSLQP